MRSRSLRLFLLGFLTLFLELALIRYLSGNIWNMGYFPNLVLLGAFLGMGLGFVFHKTIPEKKSEWFFSLVPFALLFLITFIFLRHPAIPGFTNTVGRVGGEVFFTSTPGAPGSLNLLIFVWLFVNVILVFFLVSQHTAKFFSSFAPLHAYTLDIIGSCCGILSFMLVSWLGLPAYLWFLLILLLFLLISKAPWLRITGSLIISLTTLLVWLQDTKLLSNPDYTGPFEVRWSPYQKVECSGKPGETIKIFVNGIDHQKMYPAHLLSISFYLIPHFHRAAVHLPPYRDILIIGAGSGNDAMAALENHAVRVDAVEIDPVIAQIGRLYHPLQPYSDPRVHLTIDDGRAFMTYTRRKYDLVVFAQTDSMVKVSAMAQLRLENYLFTEESVARAFHLLKPEGDLVFYNLYRFPWISDKIRLMIYRATGKFPATIYQSNNFSMFLLNQKSDSILPRGIDASLQTPHDDWPFLYLQRRGIPSIYRNGMIGLAILILLITCAVHVRERRETPGLDGNSPFVRVAFIFMGVAFLLLETKSVIQFSLLFGTTWINNSLVFLSVLLFVLLANWTVQFIAEHRASPSFILVTSYVLLMVFCIGTLFYPLGKLLGVQNVLLRFTLASVLTFSPIYFANIIFSISFRDRQIAENLFGWNLIGAAFGGILEYTSMGLGYNALGMVVAICYSIVFLILRREGKLRFAGLRSATVGKLVQSSAQTF